MSGPTNAGNGALDANGGITISGGTLFAAGSAGMAETPDASSAQGWLGAQVSGSAGATVTIATADGTVLGTYEAEKAFETVVFSTAGMSSGTTYTVTVDGASTTVTAGEALAGGMMGGGGPRR